MAKNTKRSRNLFGWTLFIVLAVGLVFVNIIGTFVNARVDMTEDHRFSLSDSTKSFLSNENNFQNRLSIKIYLSDNLPAELKTFRDAIEDKLKEFKVYAGKRIEYQFVSTNEGTDAEKQELYENLYAKGKGIMPLDVVYQKDGAQTQILLWPGATIDYEGSTVSSIQFLPGTKAGRPMPLQQLGPTINNSVKNLEYMLISSIRRATQQSKKRIGFLQGHGELRYPETQRVRSLLSPYFNVADVYLNDSLGALDNIDGLIIARPTQQFSNKELFLIDQFVMRGGRLMCFMDALSISPDSLQAKGQTHTKRITTGLEKMLFDYGLKLNDNYVVDAHCAPITVPYAKQSIVPWFFYVLATPTPHPISRNIEPVLLKYVSEVQFVGNENLAQSPVLTSSTNSNVTGMAPLVSLGMPLNYGNNPKLIDNPENEVNKRCLAGLCEGYFDSHFKNRIAPVYANNPEAKSVLEKSSVEGKVLLIGNGRFIANRYDSIPNRDSSGYLYRPQANNDLIRDAEIAQTGYQLYSGNQEFMQNVADYMLGESSVIDIRSRQVDIHRIDSKKVAEYAGFYKVINILVPCIGILLLALLLRFIRKRKFARKGS